LDERSRFEDERDKCVRDLNQRIREQNRQIERLKSQVKYTSIITYLVFETETALPVMFDGILET